MMQMFAQFTRNFKPDQNNENNPTGTQVTKKKSNYLRNGQRSKRQYPESISSCPSHDFDITTDHTHVTFSN